MMKEQLDINIKQIYIINGNELKKNICINKIYKKRQI